MAAEAMINEGGAIHQPSRAAADEELQQLRRPHLAVRWGKMLRPNSAFWAGFFAGLAVSLLDRHWRSRQ